MLKPVLMAASVPIVGSIASLVAYAAVFRRGAPMPWFWIISVAGIVGSLVGALILQRAARPITWSWLILIICYDIGMPMGMFLAGVLVQGVLR